MSLDAADMLLTGALLCAVLALYLTGKAARLLDEASAPAAVPAGERTPSLEDGS